MEELREQLAREKRRNEEEAYERERNELLAMIAAEENRKLQEQLYEQERLRAEMERLELEAMIKEQEKQQKRIQLEEMKAQVIFAENEVQLMQANREFRRLERRDKRRKREAELDTLLDNIKQEIQIASIQKEIAKKDKLMAELEKLGKAVLATNIELDPIPPKWGADWGSTVTATVSSFTLDPSTFKLNGGATKRSVSLQLKPKPFDKGTFRLAFYAQEGSKKKVLKSLIISRSFDLDYEEHKENLRLQIISKYFTDQFNAAKPRSCPVVNYTDVAIYEVMHNGVKTAMFSEDLLEGEFIKFNNNADYVFDSTIDLAPQTFSHFSYQKSAKQVLVCDIQGVRSGSNYLLTDPACHKLGTEGVEFGDANHGELGMRNFFKAHKCNRFCNEMGLVRHPSQT